MANKIKNILAKIRQKIPSWKVDIGRNLNISNSPIPRNIEISGHFRLNVGKIMEISVNK
jgi:hypothetical protein